MITLNKADTEYIKEFVEEIFVLYEADQESFIPEYIHDMGLNIKQILKEGSYVLQEKEDN